MPTSFYFLLQIFQLAMELLQLISYFFSKNSEQTRSPKLWVVDIAMASVYIVYTIALVFALWVTVGNRTQASRVALYPIRAPQHAPLTPCAQPARP